MSFCDICLFFCISRLDIVLQYSLHLFLYRGSFELQRGGNILDICGGIQAHLSTCASPKVLEVVNKFPHKVPLKEVPRLSVWPTQFHQSGVKEDNIALYFFAKDLER